MDEFTFPNVTYIRHIPASPLNEYIDYFYYLDGMMAFPHEKISPMPILDSTFA
jgi:hypothetical protein